MRCSRRILAGPLFLLLLVHLGKPILVRLQSAVGVDAAIQHDLLHTAPPGDAPSPLVEEEVRVTCDRGFSGRMADVGIVAAVPLPIDRVADGRRVVAGIGCRARVLGDTAELVNGRCQRIDWAQNMPRQVQPLYGELDRIVHLGAQHASRRHARVECEAFQVQDEDVGHRPQGDHLERTHVLAAAGAVPGVALVELLAFHEFFQAVFELDAGGSVLGGDER